MTGPGGDSTNRIKQKADDIQARKQPSNAIKTNFKNRKQLSDKTKSHSLSPNKLNKTSTEDPRIKSDLTGKKNTDDNIKSGMLSAKKISFKSRQNIAAQYNNKKTGELKLSGNKSTADSIITNRAHDPTIRNKKIQTPNRDSNSDVKLQKDLLRFLYGDSANDSSKDIKEQHPTAKKALRDKKLTNRIANLPLDREAVKRADNELYKKHPEEFGSDDSYIPNPRKLLMDREDYPLRREWMDLYIKFSKENAQQREDANGKKEGGETLPDWLREANMLQKLRSKKADLLYEKGDIEKEIKVQKQEVKIAQSNLELHYEAPPPGLPIIGIKGGIQLDIAREKIRRLEKQLKKVDKRIAAIEKEIKRITGGDSIKSNEQEPTYLQTREPSSNAIKNDFKNRKQLSDNAKSHFLSPNKLKNKSTEDSRIKSDLTVRETLTMIQGNEHRRSAKVAQEAVRMAREGINGKKLVERNNDNKGEGIKKLWENIGFSRLYGHSWCGAFAIRSMQVAGVGDREFYNAVLSASRARTYAREHPNKVGLISLGTPKTEEARNQILSKKGIIRPGDIVVWKGHVGVVVDYDHKTGTLKTAEGNTYGGGTKVHRAMERTYQLRTDAGSKKEQAKAKKYFKRRKSTNFLRFKRKRNAKETIDAT